MVETLTVRHPIRGLLWGVLVGIGLAFVLVFSTLMEFGRMQIAIAILIGVVFGLLWGLFGPAKQPKAPQPEPAVVASAPTSSRFDDITESAAEARPPESTP